MSLSYLLSLPQCQPGLDDLVNEEQQVSVTYLEVQRLQSVPPPTGMCTHGCGSEHTDKDLLGSLRIKLATAPLVGLLYR